MGFKVNYKGLDVIVESIDDLDELAERAKASTNGASAPARRSAGVSISDFVFSLGEAQQAALQAIDRAGGSMTRDDLMRRLSIPNTMSLSGRVTSPMQRRANRDGFDLETIFRQAVRESDGHVEFSIPEDAVNEVRAGLSRTLRN